MNSILPLSGTRVLAVEQYIAAPYCTMWLADYGAEVIKIEPPKAGDPRRVFQPIFSNEQTGDKISGGFLEYNRNKKSLTLDLKNPKGVSLFKELLKNADVLVENLKPGTMSRLGLDYDSVKEINPKIVYASISGFGKSGDYSGPFSDYPAFDAVLQAMGGIMHRTGTADGPPLLGVAGTVDRVSSMVAAFGIVGALYSRQKTGLGQYVDVAMYDVAISLNESAIAQYAFSGDILTRGKEQVYAPIGGFKTKDGYVGLIVPNDLMWVRFCTAIGHPEFIDDPRAKGSRTRAKNYKECFEPTVNEWMESHTSDEVVEIFMNNGIPVGKVQTSKDILECPQVKAREMIIEIDDPAAKKIKLANSPVRFSSGLKQKHQTAPRLGEHNHELLKTILNYTDESIEGLKAEGII